MKRWMLFASVLALVLVCSTVALAGPFVNPPETNAPRWDTPFPYQRNATIDFATDPDTWGVDANNPIGWELDPTTGYDLQGVYDLTLYEDDFLEHTVSYGPPELGWHAVDPTGGGRSGLFGIHNASEASQWYLNWYVNNLDDPNDFKRLWQELDWYIDGNVGVGMNVGVPQVDGWDAAVDPVGIVFGSWYTQNVWFEVQPNNPYEILTFVVTVPEGGSFLIDDWHVATECTPEPVSAILLLLGAPVALALRRRSAG